MTFYSVTEFQTMCDDLSRLFEATAAQYLANRGVLIFDSAPLAQMSTSLNEVARETIMLGADAWPDPNLA